MTPNTIRGIAIITGIAKTAHAVDQIFEVEQLNQLLTLFNQRPSGATTDYVEPHKLVHWTYSAHHAAGNNDIAEYIRKVFTWFKPKGEIDEELLL